MTSTPMSAAVSRPSRAQRLVPPQGPLGVLAAVGILTVALGGAALVGWLLSGLIARAFPTAPPYLILVLTVPVMIVLLLIMHADLEYKHWLPSDSDHNAGLLQVAKDQRINIDAIKSEAKQKFIPEPVVDAARTTLKGPAALRKDQLDAAAKKPKPAKPARAKMTAQEAQLGIAEAMQKDEAASPQQGASAVVVGSKVKVTSEKDEVGPIAGNYAGKEGVVTRIIKQEGLSTCDVKFKRGTAVFVIKQLEVVA